MLTASLTVTMLTISLTATMFVASNFRMSGPSVKILTCCLKCDVSLFARLKVTRGGRAKLCSVRQVNFNSNSFQGSFRGVLHRAVEGIALHIVGQDQPGTVPDRIVGLVQGKLSA